MRVAAGVGLFTVALVGATGCASGRTDTMRPGTDAAVDGSGRTDDAFTSADLDASRAAPDVFVPEGADAAIVGADAWSRDAFTPPTDARADECTSGASEACGTSCGSTGSRMCAAGRWGMCSPPTESCNARDDDCDGLADDGLGCERDRSEVCTTSCGSTGVRTCSSSCAWGACAPPAETCNARDDDCDGSIDDGSLCGADEACVGGSCRRTRWVFEAETALSHGFGRAEGDGWSAATGADARGIWLYGPYAREIPSGAATATFRLMVDNRSADNSTVVRIEVNDFDGRSPDCGDCVIASRDIRRMEFASAMTYQDFALAFSAPAGHRLEFRTYWHDTSYVREDRVVVTVP